MDARGRELGRFEFGPSDLRGVRQVVQAIASDRLPNRVDDVVLAVHEVAVNSVVHGAGRGVLRIDETPEAIVFTVEDEDGTGSVPLLNPIDDGAPSGRGLWIAHLLSDHLTIDVGPSRTSVRLRLVLTPEP